MSNYTISIKEMIEQGIEIFDFEYPYYNDVEGTKDLFENKFKDTFMYYEIGFEDVDMFKHYLKSKLVNLYPYYYQLYQTELRCNDIDFMLNKDLKETFTREITGNATKQSETTLTKNEQLEQTNVETNTINSSDTSSVNSTMSDEYSENNSSNTKDSSVNNGVSSAELLDGYLTTAQSTSENNSYNLDETNISDVENTSTTEGNKNATINATNTGNNTTTESTDETNSHKETTELISQGNIGVTSSAELLEKWRKVLINIDVMLLSDLRNLFLMIY